MREIKTGNKKDNYKVNPLPQIIKLLRRCVARTGHKIVPMFP
jgi:hypothetical protein